MVKEHRWLTRIVAALIWCVAATAQVYAEQRKTIGLGAIISRRGPSHRLAVLSGSFTKINKKGARILVKNLTREIIFVDQRLPSIRAMALDKYQKPKPYTRKNNPCKRAKTRKLLATLQQRVRCEPNWAYRSTVAPNDPEYSQQYASSSLSLPAAWDQTTGKNDLIAFIIDSGIQYTHPDLVGNVWSNPDEIPANGIDDDLNGYIDDIHGINAITGSGDPTDDYGHGTHCAGIIGARGNNGIGISGVAWNAKIAAAKFLNSSGLGYLSDAIESLNYAKKLKLAGHKIVVSNNSWGGGGFSAALLSAIQQSINAGILFVAAAGNFGSDNDQFPTYPASYSLDGIVSVASTNSSGSRSFFSNFGLITVDIAAPGSNIISCVPNKTFDYYSGTSMAAPHISGIALLSQSICNGSLSLSELKNTIINSGVPNPILKGIISSGAIANASNAVNKASGICNPTSTATDTPTVAATNTPEALKPTDTPTPDLPSPTPITPAPLSDGGASLTQPLSVSITPGSALEPLQKLEIRIDSSGLLATTSIQLSGSDSYKRLYQCPKFRLPLQNGAAHLSVPLPRSSRYFKSITVSTSAKRLTTKDTAAMSKSNPLKNQRDAQQHFKQLCTALKRAADYHSAKISGASPT
jgi:subtilisin family serine protease